MRWSSESFQNLQLSFPSRNKGESAGLFCIQTKVVTNNSGVNLFPWFRQSWVLPGASGSQQSNWMTSLGLEDDEDQATAAKRKAKQEQSRMRKRAKLLADGSWVDNNDLLPVGWMMKGELGSPCRMIIKFKF